MSTLSCLRVALCALSLALALGCGGANGGELGGGGNAGNAGSSGSGGSGAQGGSAGMGGMIGSDAGLDCNEVGCDDGNDCTSDGVCNTVMGICIGGGDDEAINSPCDNDGGAYCDGVGACVVCNDDFQCALSFPPQECRQAATCVDNDCPVPEPLPDGSPCDGGQCIQGQCTATKWVPMVCDNSVTPFFWDMPMDVTVDPSTIEATREFTADIRASFSIPQEFLQFGVISVYPAVLDALDVDTAAAELVTSGVTSGSPASASLASTPITVAIPQVPNPGDSGGSDCSEDTDCPLAAFGQNCGASGQCDCACMSGCAPEACPNMVTGDLVLPNMWRFKAPYTAASSGEVCFDVGGKDPPSAVGAPPVRTGIRAVASNGAFVRFECVGGTANDNGTPGFPLDDFVDPNPASAQICFPIEMPDMDLCAGPPPVDCADDNQCARDAVCDPFTGGCKGGASLPRGTLCDQDGGKACDGQGACVQCVEDSGCADDGNQCTTAPACVDDSCRLQTNLPQGALCNQNGGNRCDGNGNCIDVGDGPFPVTAELTLGCTQNLDSDVSIISFELTVAPESPVQGESFAADLSGVASIPEDLLDAVQWAIPGGVTRLNLIDLAATVHVRSGATGNDVRLAPQAIPYRCAQNSSAACDPANDLPGEPGRRGNSDCVPVAASNPCGRFLEIPTSSDCAPGGACAVLDGGTGTKLNQCGANGFCVAASLAVPLESQVSSYAAIGPEVLWGWDDASTGATLRGNGTWDLPPAVFAEPTGPNGFRINVDGLAVAYECTMAVDSDGEEGVGVPGQSSPTPSALLIGFPVAAP